MVELVGIGLYTPAEAARLVSVPSGKISRWLRGHSANGRDYDPLWLPQVDLGDGKTYLGFRDLMEIRVAAAFITAGVSAQRVRAAIEMAREIVGIDRPLSTDRFRTDGCDIFLRVVEQDDDGHERARLLNTFRRQYAFAEIIDPSLKGVEFDEAGIPMLWRPRGKRGLIVVDPARSFGQPIDEPSSVPTAVLAAAGRQEGIDMAARAYEVAPASVRRAMAFEDELGTRLAA